MDKAKAAVSEFMHKAGHNDTTVHEKVAPAVVQQNVTKHRHEEATTAIDREIHQDHYHTSVQPIKDREVLPEEHIHQMAAVEEREQYHGDDAAIKARLEQERLQFQSTRTEGGTRESHSVAPTIAGEHVHHHVHETIQPVIQKETIQPSVVHTTIPVHEVHHNEAKHHAATALPAVSMADFKKQGGSLTGREERYDGFEGEPRAVGSALGASSTMGTTGLTGTTGHRGHHGHHDTTGTTGSTTSRLENKLDPRVDSTGSGYGDRTTTGSGYGDRNTTGTGSSYGDSTTGTKKPSLMDRLNPMKDTDGDGKKGIMD
ncbi:hypothetical protein LPUS_02652 [Lasallia pustulata]|uniref:Allergen n=1 Tax=Lasallia pustulata TaxID=136370 RepID=A0A1W5CT90_9LECA|nr:hypothetical protein LPUS_02652 [Lasallia pustulata]